MLKLSKSMRNYLREKKMDPDIKGSNATLKALNKRGLCWEDGALTKMGDVTAISLYPLQKQCLFMNILLEDLALQYSGIPEEAVLGYLKNTSKLAYYTENTFGVHVAQFFMFKYQYEIAIKNETNLYSINFTKDDCLKQYIYDDVLSDLDEKLSKINYSTIDENYYLIEQLNRQHDTSIRFSCTVNENEEVIVSANEPRDESGRFMMTLFYQDIWDIDFYKNVYSFLGIEFIRNLIKFIIYKPNKYATGWPDIIVLEENPYFIEVKTTDRFHLSQIATMPDVIQKLGIPIKCLRVNNC
jgi:hypothetical protein